MANVLIYDTKTSKVKEYLVSVDTGRYSQRDDVLIQPDLSNVQGVPQKYWIVKNKTVEEMTQVQKDTVDAPAIAEQNKILTLRLSITTKLESLGLTNEEINYILDKSVTV